MMKPKPDLVDPGPDYPYGAPAPTKEQPHLDMLRAWEAGGYCEATDGCTIEPDGTCEHGHISWLRYVGLI